MVQLSVVVSFQMTQYFINKHIKLRDFEPAGRKGDQYYIYYCSLGCGQRIEHTLTARPQVREVMKLLASNGIRVKAFAILCFIRRS